LHTFLVIKNALIESHLVITYDISISLIVLNFDKLIVFSKFNYVIMSAEIEITPNSGNNILAKGSRLEPRT